MAAKLRATGYEIFFDKKTLRGDKFDDRVRNEVENCDLFVVFISEASLRKDSYVRTGAAAWRARVAQFRRWSRHNWAVLVIMALVVTGSASAIAYQSSVAQREAKLLAQFERLSMQLKDLIGRRERAEREKDSAERELAELVKQSTAAPQPAELDVKMEATKKRLELADAELARLDQERKVLEQQLEAAKSAFVVQHASVAETRMPPLVAIRSAMPRQGAKYQPESDRDCKFECANLGKCTTRDGECVVTSNEDCKKSSGCTGLGPLGRNQI